MSDNGKKSDWPLVVLILGFFLGPMILMVLADIFGGK